MNVLLVEDETHIANLLKEIIELDDTFNVIKTLETVVDTVLFFSENQEQVDLCFFDIHLADGHSFEIFKHIDIIVPVIFCTAYHEYAMKAIKNNGIDYILKPFKEEEIFLALKKYRKLASSFRKGKSKPIQLRMDVQPEYQKRFLTQFRGKTSITHVNDVAMFQIKNETLFITTFDGKRLPFYKKMEYLESITDPNQFFRVNRQTLLSRKAIDFFEALPSRKLSIHLVNDIPEMVIVSRLKVTKFKKWLAS